MVARNVTVFISPSRQLKKHNGLSISKNGLSISQNIMMRNEREFEKEFEKDYVLLTRNGMKHVGRASQNQNQNQKHGNKYGGLYAYKVHKHHNHDPKFAFKLHQKLKVNKPSKQVKRHGVVVKTSSRHHKPTFVIEVNNVRQCSGLRKKHCNRSKRDLYHKKSICNRKMKPSKQEETRFSRMTESEFSTLIKNHLKLYFTCDV